MPAAKNETLAVNGYTEFLRACATCGKAVDKEVRNALREAAKPVLEDARAKEFNRLRSRKSAAGLRTVVRTRGVSVEQSLRKTTGQRPKWGGTQMRYALVPALQENVDETARKVDEAMDNIVDLFALTARWQRTGLL